MKNIILAITLLLTFSANQLQAKVLFEGWFEVISGAKKVGFFVSRYEFIDNKFKIVTYLKTNGEGNDVTESIKAFSAADLKPLNYSYTSKTGDKIKIIDATFTGEKANYKINDGKKETKTTKVIKKGTFLSSILLYMIMSQKDGLSAGKNYTYNAIAEEDGTAYVGTAKVVGLVKVKGKDAYKIINKFKDDSFFTWVTPKGEFLLTRLPTANLDVRFADTQEQATKDITANLSDLKLLFGKLPGAQAAVSSPTSSPGTTETPEVKAPEKNAKPSKAGGATFPSGQGVMIKGAPPVPAPSPSASPKSGEQSSP